MNSLVLDARFLSTGLGTYTLNLVRELAEHSDIPVHLLTLPQYRESLAQYPGKVTIVDAPMYSLSEQLKVAWAARAFGVLHVPHYNAPLLRRGTLLVTIHDLNHILDRSYRRSWKSAIYAQPMFRLVARRANHIFTVSQYSKRQIETHLGVEPERITVAYNGIGAHIVPEDRKVAQAKMNRELEFSGPYILFVGNLKPSKNVEGLLKAFALLQARSNLPHRLVMVGDDVVGRRAVADWTRDLHLEGKVVRAPSLNNAQIRSAYSGADVTVLPSFEEGFGLPVVESMACGTPVVCSQAASLPEVAGDAADFFDPHDAESISAAIEKVLLSSDRWRELQALGLVRARRFTREESARRHIAVYRRFLGA